MQNRSLVLLLGASVWLWSPDAFSAVQSFCATVEANFTDNGYGEDYWTTDAERSLPGINARVRYYPGCGTTGTSGSYTEYVSTQHANSGGCVQFVATPTDACFLFTVYTSGSPDTSNDVYAYGDTGLLGVYSYWVDPPNAGGTTYQSFGDVTRLRLYAVIAYAPSGAFRGWLGATSIHVYDSNDSAVCGCAGSGNRWCDDSGNGRICLSHSATSEKFLVAHEYGHHNLHYTAGDWGSDCSVSNSCSGSHCMTGREFQSCAMMEGWGNFVSADVWNDDSGTNPGGKLRYWGDCDGDSTIDIESTGNDADCVVAYMESNYSNTSWPGHATELDWMRAFWDFHTNDVAGHPGTPQSHFDLQDMFSSYLPTTSDAERSYDLLRLGCADNLGCAEYERIVYMADANGADHCENDGQADECENVPGCTDVD